MQSTHLACPYCGSTLTFGQGIAAGTSVPCLICGRSFIAADNGGRDKPSVQSTPPAPAPSNVQNASIPVAPLPAAAPPGNGRALLAGGIAFGVLAVLMIGGMTVGLRMAFG